MILVRNIRVPIAENIELSDAVCRELSLNPRQIDECSISKISVDARHGKQSFVCTAAVVLKEPDEEAEIASRSFNASLAKKSDFSICNGTKKMKERPVICGFGPAGLFAALVLARQGFAPLVIERGPALKQRIEAVKKFSATGILTPNANIQFGEGGAGTFSDGKLTTRIGDELCGYVTDILLKHGAPGEIAWKQKPHVGTDLLREVIYSIRQEIENLGGSILFNTRLRNIRQQNNNLYAIEADGSEGSFLIPCKTLILAVGHSARDVFSMLIENGWPIECKPFSVGFRAEHLQRKIDESLYHKAAGHPALPHGEYQLSKHLGKRCVYTFCMCPGGQVVASTSEDGSVVTNGMSYHARKGKNANAAVVVSVNGNDFNMDPTKAIAFQRELEKKAFLAGGGQFCAPASNVQSFLQGIDKLKVTDVEPTYDRGVTGYNLDRLLPRELSESIKAGLRSFDRKLAGYTAPDAILTGLETRTSSPVRIPRNECYEYLGIAGVYPCGEGAGYAGGIMSAAVDGVRVAKSIAERYCPAE